ncbi:hypothetical protein WICPIJ_004922 [Wickerhamomyces pijperi]|uniref:Uncharacterized protein n=1 Tax=Wickerhamomyces pijperi TaxID=599730 RepID=A0A9P8Q4T5_WICPI|nr:hypothetical protein WICPIJ_004922 [Wickerhamomyces pijperi]
MAVLLLLLLVESKEFLRLDFSVADKSDEEEVPTALASKIPAKMKPYLHFFGIPGKTSPKRKASRPPTPKMTIPDIMITPMSLIFDPDKFLTILLNVKHGRIKFTRVLEIPRDVSIDIKSSFTDMNPTNITKYTFMIGFTAR